jgi:chromosome segregation ATPase
LQQVASHESSKNEVARQQDAMRLNTSATAKEEAAKELRDENSKLASRCDRAADEAAAKSERYMQDRISENQQMRRRLATEIQETHQKIEQSKQLIHDTKNQIKSLEEPIELTSTCASWRKQRSNKEHIMDPVSTKLSEHQSMLLRSNEELRQHHRSEKGALQELQERRERLIEDLRDKTTALHIDLNCLTHEALHLNGKAGKSLSKHKLHRALKVDPTFVPMLTPGAAYTGVPNGAKMPMSAR